MDSKTLLTKQVFEVANEATRLERERILELYYKMKARLYLHINSGTDTTKAQDIFAEFEDRVSI